MDDAISLADLPVQTHIGVPDAERAEAQTLLVSVELFTNLSKAGASDDIGDTIDYDHVAEVVRSIGKSKCNTLENFAENTAKAILETFAPNSVKITVCKPNIAGARHAAVTIIRPQKSTESAPNKSAPTESTHNESAPMEGCC